MWRLLGGFLRKDAKLFALDRQAVVMSFIIPILVASILGWLDSTAESGSDARISLIAVDLDDSTISKAVLGRLAKEDHISLKVQALQGARSASGKGDSIVAIFPKGFGTESQAALTGGPKPVVTELVDPSKTSEGQIVEGAILDSASHVVAQQVFGGLAGNASAPLEVKQQSSATNGVKWGSAAHDFAGFGLMGLMLFAVEAAVSLLRDRKLGIWRRLRASPVAPGFFVLSRGVSSTVLALAIFFVMFGAGAGMFGIRVLGSVPGFFLVALATAAMCACLGILIAMLGRSENQARGIATLAVFVMLATGGAWFPLSRMPEWVQNGALYLPVRWAIEGLDAMTWRGMGFGDSLRYAGVLWGFAALFLILSLPLFRFIRDG